VTSGLFPETRSTVLDLASEDPERRARCLEVVAGAYWKPVYKYLRLRWSADVDRAEDLTQSFFATAIDREMLAGYEPGRARFRTFLRACLDRHVIDEHRRTRAKRRGGTQLQLEFSEAEGELASASRFADPHEQFEAEWLRHIMHVAVQRLEARLAEAGKPIHANLFSDYHLKDGAPSYAEAAARYAISVSNVTNWLHATRREFRRVALEVLAELTLDEADFAAEAMAVFGIDIHARDR
jgi:RNA polymerase sigma factor (sigma-70 family)